MRRRMGKLWLPAVPRARNAHWVATTTPKSRRIVADFHSHGRQEILHTSLGVSGSDAWELPFWRCSDSGTGLREGMPGS